MLAYQRVDDSFPFNMVPFFWGVPFVHFAGVDYPLNPAANRGLKGFIVKVYP